MVSQNSNDAGETRSVVGYLKQTTAFVTALTALVAGVTAFVVAGKSGWREVGPYFSHLIQHGETKIPDQAASSKPLVQSIDPALISSLESEQHDIRANARKALSAAISTADPESVDTLVDQVSESKSYRKQLGLAVALGNVPKGWPSAAKEKTIETLLVMRDQSADPTLRGALDRASKAARP